MEKLRHSRLGIVSVSMGAIGFFVTFVLVVAAAFLNSRGVVDEENIFMVLLGLFIFADIILLSAGAAVGLAGLFRPYRKKLLSFLGMFFNAGIMAALILLLMAGLKP